MRGSEERPREKNTASNGGGSKMFQTANDQVSFLKLMGHRVPPPEETPYGSLTRIDEESLVHNQKE